MHSLAAALQIVGVRFLDPALEVQPNDDSPTLRRIGYLMIGRKPSRSAFWEWVFSEHAFDGLVIRAASGASITNGSDLVHAQWRMLGFEVEDKSFDIWRQPVRRLWC